MLKLFYAAHTCALAVSGSVRCWGGNQSGQVGIGSTAPMTAGEVALREPAIGIAAGGSRSCAIIVSGGAQCWGDALAPSCVQNNGMACWLMHPLGTNQ